MQIGSYFGGVLQTLDVNGDSYTDLLLVGAPMYMGSERNEQGQVYVYKLSKVQKINKMRLCEISTESHTGKVVVIQLLVVSHCVFYCVFFLCIITRTTSLSTSSP